MESNLVESVKKTIAWFSLFNYPLTITELWQWLWSPGQDVSYQEVYFLVQSGQINTIPPFVVMSGRESDIETRAQRYLCSVRKQRKALLATWWLSWLPWIEGVALCNSLGYQNARDESDIDFFIITKPNTVWLTRLLSTVALQILGQRPSEDHGRDTLCFSFYISSDAMNLQPMALLETDPYLTYWVTQLNPLFGRDSIWQRFFEANSWVKKYLPNTLPYAPSHANWYYREGWRGVSAGVVLRLCEKFAKYLQVNYLSKVLYGQANLINGNVIMTDKVLKLHTTDRRLYYKNLWNIDDSAR